MNIPIQSINLYLLAGVATDPLFMEGFGQAMKVRLHQAGWAVRSELLLPYGDWSRSIFTQLREMRHDLWPIRHRPLHSIGGNRAADALRGTSPGGVTLLLGHSGGGIAALHATSILTREGWFTPSDPPRIVQIGSPKCPIPAWLRKSTLYAAAVNANGKLSDPVTRLGSWGGWRRNAYGIPVWRAKADSPGTIVHLPLIGGHADYFRQGQAYVNTEGLSNLDITVRAVYDWLKSTWETDFR
ncbi:hypothetical protein [Paenibacillus xerothermodurans]|uniref:hypothetical protein n=1 Tax=Paenibacillus xerothermodurans TaxID=1977292 RepID=UPI0010576153|nr:hypothetical protein [Paenibacillus xerothermodurans]